MNVKTCPACQVSVVPKADGHCPSCQHDFASPEVHPRRSGRLWSAGLLLPLLAALCVVTGNGIHMELKTWNREQRAAASKREAERAATVRHAKWLADLERHGPNTPNTSALKRPGAVSQ